MPDRAAPVIWVVEDATDAREALGEILTARFPGSRVLTTESSEAGLELIRRTRPSVVLLDLHPHVIHGFEFADRVRRLDGGATTPIVALTGDLSPATLMRGEAAGFAAVLRKPADPDRLETVLRPLLDNPT